MPKEPLRTLLSILLILLIGAAVAWAGSQGGTAVDGWPVFGICAAISFSLNAVVFLHAYRFRTERFFDLTGSITYLVLLASALLLTNSVSARDLILAGMIACWAIRLGSFLFSRVTRDGADGRFDRVKFQPLQFLMWWILQGLWVLLTAACALAAISSSASPPLGAFAAIGCGLWLLGMVIEIVSDEQKKDFRKRPENHGGFIKTGLWAWSRHPNYFGEITLWAGIAVIALPALSGWQLATLISPLFVYFLLTRISGIPILEARAKRRWGDESEFQKYLKHTPILFPRPPR
jgi:steroid 5-alpha reductase family enzyme